MVDDGLIFLRWKTGENSFLDVQQKREQNAFVRLGIPRCSAECDIIISVSQFIVCFESVQILF